MTESRMDALPIVDFKNALERLGHDEQLLRELAQFYEEDALVLLQNLDRGLQDKDVELAARSCHSLSSLSLNFDGHRVAHIAKQVEQLANTRNFPALEELVPQLKLEIELLMKILKTELIAGQKTVENS